MPNPSFQQWRTLSSTANGLTQHDINGRILAALATIVSKINPDGSAKVP